MPGHRHCFAYSLTNAGLIELKAMGEIELDKVQTKSNTPEHDLGLTDLRIFFSKFKNCHLFLPENIIKAKFLEEDIMKLVVFRSLKADAVVKMSVRENKHWFAVEYERTEKAKSRYVKRMKTWYDREDLTGVLMFTESRNLMEKMMEIDATICPDRNRKILYLPMEEISSSRPEVKFQNSRKNNLTIPLGEDMKILYPILDQSFTYDEPRPAYL